MSDEHQPVQLTEEARIAEALAGVTPSPTCSHYRINGHMSYRRVRTIGERSVDRFKETGWSCLACAEIEEARSMAYERFDIPARDAIRVLEGQGYFKTASALKEALHG